MELTQCAMCGKDISPRAKNCLSCGHPSSLPAKPNHFWINSVLAIGFVVLVARFFFVTRDWQLVILGTLLLFPPLWYPLQYYIFAQNSEQKEYCKNMKDMWGPFWAAVSAFLAAYWIHKPS